MRAIVTVVGRDRAGIVGEVGTLLAGHGVNILDISQTILDGYFTMMMLVELPDSAASFAGLADSLEAEGHSRKLSVRIQREDIFEAMHRI